jgi:hypothetical protein
VADDLKVAVGGEAGAPTLEQLQELAVKKGWYEGVPVPVKGLAIQLEDRHPLAGPLEQVLDQREIKPRVCTTTDVDDTTVIRNQWRSEQLGNQEYILAERGGKVGLYLVPFNTAAGMLIDTLMASHGWTLEAEQKALEKLRELVADHIYESYFLTGMFFETSKRSGVHYLFRKLRPTLAIRPTKEGGTRILAALCLHPLGLYQGTWAGTMVPTDDVIAHLLLMRGDEPRFWRQANQHPAHAKEAGIF